MKIKEWKYDEMMSKVTRYGDLWMNIDTERDEANHGMVKVDENGYVTLTCRVEVIRETEKAVYVELGNSWKEWLPKSCIAA